MRADAITFGVEEEFFLLDAETLRPTPLAGDALALLRERGVPTAKAEFLASQVECATGVCTTAAEASEQLATFRRTLAEAAGRGGAVAAGVGAPFDADQTPVVTADDRYAHVVADIGSLLDDHQVCGLHVHLGVPDAEQRVRVLNGFRAWMPVLTALAANSPFWRGVDTGFASWRTVVMRRWTTNGIPAAFVDAADYDRRVDELVGLGVTRDRALVAWLLRVSHHLPTIELRFGDAQLEADDSVAIALLCRSIAASLLDTTDATGPAFSGEMLDAAVWEAARSGLDAVLPDPIDGGLRVAHEVIAAAATGADDETRSLVGAMLARRGGADRQRDAYRAAGVDGLRRMLEASVAPSPSLGR